MKWGGGGGDVMVLAAHLQLGKQPAGHPSMPTILMDRSRVKASLHSYGKIASAPGPFFILGFERAWYAKIRHLTSVGVSMETPSFTMTSFQSAYGQVVAWCEYLSSELMVEYIYS